MVREYAYILNALQMQKVKRKEKRKHIAMRISEERNSGKTTSNKTGSVICNDKAKETGRMCLDR
jgi:hypothetical protein